MRDTYTLPLRYTTIVYWPDEPSVKTSSRSSPPSSSTSNSRWLSNSSRLKSKETKWFCSLSPHARTVSLPGKFYWSTNSSRDIWNLLTSARVKTWLACRITSWNSPGPAQWVQLVTESKWTLQNKRMPLMANLYIIVNMYVCLHLRSVVNATAHARCDIFNRFTIEQSVKVLLSGVQYESWLFLSTHSRTCVLFAVIHFWAVWLTASTKIGIKTCGIINAVKGTSYLRHFVVKMKRFFFFFKYCVHDD